MLTDLWQSIKPAKVRTPVCQRLACACILPYARYGSVRELDSNGFKCQ